MQHTINAETRYITSIEKESQWNLNVNTVGFEAIPAHSTYPTAGHPQGYYFDFEKGRVLQEFQMVYITRGKGMFVSKLKQEITVPEGSMFVLFPGEWHTYKPGDQTGWESYWVGFNGSFAQELLADKQSYISNPVLNIGYDEEIVSLYKKILEISANERPGYQNLLSGIVIHLLSYILYREKNKNLNDKEVFNKIDKARLIIREKLNTAISPEEIAASLNMSYTWFRRMFKNYTGLAPAQYISQLKIQKAKELLSVTNKTVKEIAFDLGFESVDYFSTQFRKQTNQTPTQFRNLGIGK
jgi:AraC-like DNA-binding protein/quercetin dioxygenase-like cupin family protein